MQVENQVRPDPQSVQGFLSASDAPVVMVNLLRFKARAEYADGRETQLTGEEAYRLYGEAMRQRVEAAGGRVRFTGRLEGILLGRVEEPWDLVALVEYPSPRTLIEIASRPDFHEIEAHREAGLAGQLNLTVREESPEQGSFTSPGHEGAPGTG